MLVGIGPVGHHLFHAAERRLRPVHGRERGAREERRSFRGHLLREGLEHPTTEIPIGMGLASEKGAAKGEGQEETHGSSLENISLREH